MPDAPLAILAGKKAHQRISDNGWDPSLFSAMVGASGGAKLLGLTCLDQYLFGEYLQQTSHPMDLYGSSIGSWRHAALAAPDPLAAVTELHERYLNQRWDEDDPRDPGEVVDELCQWVIDGFCTTELQRNLCEHPRFTSHIVTARGLGLNNRGNSVRLGLGLGLSALGNVLSRQLLALGFQRVVFSSGESRAFEFSDFDTVHVPLKADLVRPALLASGSIPFLMPGLQDIPDSPAGQYWDGGIIDYHFDFSNHADEGLILYPHFSERTIIGWFDKSLPWRANSGTQLDRTVILAPSRSYLARLPHGKIPDRKDFNRMPQDERIRYWRSAMTMSQELADAFAEIVNDNDPTRLVTRLD